MKHVSFWLVILALVNSAIAQQPKDYKLEPKIEAKVDAQATAKVTKPTVDYLQIAAKSSIFIYDGATKPCDSLPDGVVLLPAGSGFVVGIAEKGRSPEQWRGWKFLVTAAHV